MLIISDLSGDYRDGYNTSLNIEQYSGDDDGDAVFFYGISCGINKDSLHRFKEYRRKILLDLWSPCAFFADPNHFSILEGFDEVYSICPYTCDWTNDQLGKKVMKYSFYPVTPDTIRPQENAGGIKGWVRYFLRQDVEPGASEISDVNKRYDVCYVGGAYSQEHRSMIDIISKYKYIFVSQGQESEATHKSISNAEKINLVAKCKIGICFNKLYPTQGHIANVMNYAAWQDNKAFSHLHDPIPIAPQIKTRLHELALCKTLILCHRDPWNLIEDYYEPGKDFLYFDRVEDLNTMIPEILQNMDSYQHIVESAYAKVRNFSTANLVKMVRNGEEFKRE